MNIRTFQDRHGKWRAVVEADGIRIWTLASPTEHGAVHYASRLIGIARVRGLTGDLVELYCSLGAELVPKTGNPYLMQDPEHYTSPP